MKISCPRCFTNYIVVKSSTKIIGRVLRCSTCGNSWRYWLKLNQDNILADNARPFATPIYHRRENNRQDISKAKYYPYGSIESKFNQISQIDAAKQAHDSKPVSSLQSLDKPKTSSISQCVFCRRSPKCNMHDLYSGQRH